MKDEPAPISLPHRRRKERILIAAISAIVGAGLASLVFIANSPSLPPAAGRLPLTHEPDGEGTTHMAGANIARRKAPAAPVPFAGDGEYHPEDKF